MRRRRQVQARVGLTQPPRLPLFPGPGPGLQVCSGGRPLRHRAAQPAGKRQRAQRSLDVLLPGCPARAPCWFCLMAPC